MLKAFACGLSLPYLSSAWNFSKLSLFNASRFCLDCDVLAYG
ncbi:Hypothetical protein AJF4211_003360 [Avibacterium paragallinarum JF4211]|nr:Hypothetical protein AJF4211_003360 [Avibacterium paragallinarum JF4211]